MHSGFVLWVDVVAGVAFSGPSCLFFSPFSVYVHLVVCQIHLHFFSSLTLYPAVLLFSVLFLSSSSSPHFLPLPLCGHFKGEHDSSDCSHVELGLASRQTLIFLHLFLYRWCIIGCWPDLYPPPLRLTLKQTNQVLESMNSLCV